MKDEAARKKHRVKYSITLLICTAGILQVKNIELYSCSMRTHHKNIEVSLMNDRLSYLSGSCR